MSRSFLVASIAALLAAALAPNAGATQGSRFHNEVRTPLGVVATESPAAARVGRSILEKGGHAIDAAAATVFAMGVARPQSCGIGGGGFMVYRSVSGRVRTLDFRETAPAAMRPESLSGPGLHTRFTGHLTVGVPGIVAGMDAALTRYGRTTLQRAVAPAEQLARNGVIVPASLSAAMAANAERLKLFPAAAAQFLHPNGTSYVAGQRLVQPDLAASLRRIIRGGRRAFYEGTIARRIVRDMRAPRPDTQDPGLLTLRDFANYRAKWRTPLSGTFRGRTVHAMGPPTSGGVAILQMLRMLEPFDLRTLGATSTQAIHLVAEAQKLAFADRAQYLADPDFVRQPLAGLLSPAYLESRRQQINQERAGSYGPGVPPENPTGTTTHISVIDSVGNAVAITCTNEQEFGSAVVAPGTGILLNNELTDFGAPGTANEPAPGKRPRSSMSPTIVEQSGQPVLVTGGAGGARIIMGVLHSILRTAEFGESLAQAVDAERWDNLGTNRLNIEDTRIHPGVLSELEARGHTLVREGEYGVRPRIQLAGVDLATRDKVAVSDSRSDQGSLAQRGDIAVAEPVR